MLQLFKREEKEDTIRSGVRALVACKMQLSMHFLVPKILPSFFLPDKLQNLVSYA